MTEDFLNFDLPQNKSSIIKVIGVGGGGNNAPSARDQGGADTLPDFERNPQSAFWSIKQRQKLNIVGRVFRSFTLKYL